MEAAVGVEGLLGPHRGHRHLHAKQPRRWRLESRRLLPFPCLLISCSRRINRQECRCDAANEPEAGCSRSSGNAGPAATKRRALRNPSCTQLLCTDRAAASIPRLPFQTLGSSRPSQGNAASHGATAQRRQRGGAGPAGRVSPQTVSQTCCIGLQLNAVPCKRGGGLKGLPIPDLSSWLRSSSALPLSNLRHPT